MTTNGTATATADTGDARGAAATAGAAQAAGPVGNASAAQAAARAVPRVRPTTNGTERRKERGVTLRVLTYVAVAHLLAFYLWLLFAVVGKG
jgi:hypothetical protein